MTFCKGDRVMVSRPAHHEGSPGWLSSRQRWFTGAVEIHDGGCVLVQIDHEHKSQFNNNTYWLCKPEWLTLMEGPW